MKRMQEDNGTGHPGVGLGVGGDFCERDGPCEIDGDAYAACVSTSAE